MSSEVEPLLNYSKVLQELEKGTRNTNNLLLGNGFSICTNKDFVYKNLIDKVKECLEEEERSHLIGYLQQGE